MCGRAAACSQACLASLSAGLSHWGRGVWKLTSSHQHHWAQGPTGREGSSNSAPYPRDHNHAEKVFNLHTPLQVAHFVNLVGYLLWPVGFFWGEHHIIYFFLVCTILAVVVMAMLFCMTRWVVMWDTDAPSFFFFFFALRFKAALQQSSIVLSSQVKGTGLKAEGEAAKMSRYPDFYSQGSISKKAGY